MIRGTVRPLGFTGAMSRRQQEPPPQPGGPDEGIELRDGVLLSETIQIHDGRRVIAVRAEEAEGRAEAEAERDLLLELADCGVLAAPRVVAAAPDGYLRELPMPLRRGDGRHAADLDSPGTEERLGRSRAREDLEHLLEALHERGWVLGSPAAAPVAVRTDGSVTVLDLAGLQPSSGIGPRLSDRHWLDLALDDGDRTLPRSAIDLAQETIDVLILMRDGAAEVAERGSALERRSAVEAWLEEPGQAEAPAAREEQLDSGVRTAAQVRAAAQLLPESARGDRAARLLASRRASASEPSERRGEEILAAVAALRTPRALILLLGGGLLLGALLWALLTVTAQEPVPVAEQPPEAMETIGTDSVSGAPPQLLEADGVAADLLEHRHEYITGARDDSVAVPGSVAAEQDRTVREAYADAQVDGGRPEVLEATWLRVAPDTALAELEVVLRTPAHTVTEESGARDQVAGTQPVRIVLELEWDGAEWGVLAVREQA